MLLIIKNSLGHGDARRFTRVPCTQGKCRGARKPRRRRHLLVSLCGAFFVCGCTCRQRKQHVVPRHVHLVKNALPGRRIGGGILALVQGSRRLFWATGLRGMQDGRTVMRLSPALVMRSCHVFSPSNNCATHSMRHDTGASELRANYTPLLAAEREGPRCNTPTAARCYSQDVYVRELV